MSNRNSHFRLVLQYISDVFLPFLRWLPEAARPAAFRGDLMAGITTALVVIPQSMANAQLAGLPPHVGLYASFLPAVAAALFGSSRQLSTGPVAIVSLLTATSLTPLVRDNPDAYLGYAVALALVVGVFQLALGLLRLGVVVNFLSHPVVMAFTNAGALIIAISQLDKLLGIRLPQTSHLYDTVWFLAKNAWSLTHLPTLAIGLLAGVIIIIIKRFARRIPGILVAVVITTVLSWYLKLDVQGVRVVGHIQAGLPSLSVPSFSWSDALRLVPAAIAISVIGFMEAISIAKSMAAQTRQRLDANQELVGQGLANIAASLTQGYAVSGSFARSAVNFGAGAKTAMSSVITGLGVALALVFFTPLLYHLPVSVLAAIVITAVVNLVHLKPLVSAWKVQKEDGLVAAATFVSIMLLAPHLEYGIIIGVVMSLVMYLARTMRPNVMELSRHADGTLRPIELFDLEQCSRIAMLRFDGALYFANSDAFEKIVLERVAMRPDLQYLVLDSEAINEIDASGVHTITQLEERLKASGIELLFARAKRQLTLPLRRVGFLKEDTDNQLFRIRNQAIMYAWSKIENCPREGCTQTCPLRRTTDTPVASPTRPRTGV